MDVREHADEAQEFLAEADRKFAEGRSIPKCCGAPRPP